MPSRRLLAAGYTQREEQQWKISVFWFVSFFVSNLVTVYIDSLIALLQKTTLLKVVSLRAVQSLSVQLSVFV